MKNSQLIDIVRSLTKKEVRELKKWLVSPAHNHRDDVVRLFEYLLSADHLYNDKYLEKEKVYKKLFPRQSFDDAKIRQTIHFLLKAIEEYLTIKELLDDDIVAKLALARSYRHKKLDKVYLKTIKNLQKAQTQERIQDDNFYHNEYLLLDEEYDSQTVKNPANTSLQGLSDTLEVAFIIRKLRLACLMFNHQSIYKKEYNFGLFEHLIKYVEENDLLRVTAIKIYYYCYKSITDRENEQNYFKFRDTLFSNDHILPHSEMRDNYLLAINYCLAKANQFKVSFRRELFELYKKGIENKVLFDDEGRLSNSIFRNTVNIGTILLEFEWTRQFIDDYQEFLPESTREQMVLTSLGKFYFEKKEYDQARDYLMQVNPNDVLLNLNIKSMLLRIYYHEDEFQLLDALLESMKVYINRKKMLVAQYRVPFKNLIRYTKKLMKVNPFDRKEKAKLRAEIEGERQLIAKSWFLEQVDRL